MKEMGKANCLADQESIKKRFEQRVAKGLRDKERTFELLKNDPRERTCTVARSEERMRSSFSSLLSEDLRIPETNPDIYGRQLKYSTTFKRLESAGNILAENKELIKKFLAAVEVNGNIKTYRLIKYCDKLTTIAKCGTAQGKPFNSMTASDVNSIIIELKRKVKTRGVGRAEKLNYSINTINDFVIIMKIFWRWVKNWKELGYPPEVKDLKVARVPKIVVTRSDLLTEDELGLLIRACNSVMYSALIWTLYDTGGRIGEVLALRVGDVQPQVYGARLNFYASKTYARPMPVVRSAPAIVAWLAIHPFNKYPEAPLWINTKLKQLMYGTARKKLLNTCRDAEKITGRKLWKRVHFHLFRHMAATDFVRESKGSQGIMNKRFGWSPSSDMAARYSHLLEEDVEMAIVRADAPADLYEKFVKDVQATKSINPKRATKPLLQLCKRCQSTNDMFAHYCSRCGFPLSDQATKAVLVNEVETRLKEESITNFILRSPIIREAVKRTLVETIDKKLPEISNSQTDKSAPE